MRMQPSGCFAPVTQSLNRKELINTLEFAAFEDTINVIPTSQTVTPVRRMFPPSFDRLELHRQETLSHRKVWGAVLTRGSFRRAKQSQS
jgi:hypothetical protein